MSARKSAKAAKEDAAKRDAKFLRKAIAEPHQAAEAQAATRSSRAATRRVQAYIVALALTAIGRPSKGR